jgi:hypothetical protein
MLLLLLLLQGLQDPHPDTAASAARAVSPPAQPARSLPAAAAAWHRHRQPQVSVSRQCMQQPRRDTSSWEAVRGLRC